MSGTGKGDNKRQLEGSNEPCDDPSEKKNKN
jgi:hypothetical protein